MRKLLVILALLAAGITQAQNPIRKIAFTQGQQLEKSTTMKMTIDMEMMGMPLTMEQGNTITSGFEVTNATAKDFTVTSTVKRIVSTMSGMGQDMTYDSDKPEDRESEIGKALGEKLGKPTRVTVDQAGVVTASDDSDTSSNQESGMMEAFGGNMMSNARPGAQFELIAKLPARALKAGDSWTDSTSEADGTMVTNYKVMELKSNGEAVIAMDGTIARVGQVEQAGMNVNLDMKGSLKGSFTAETASGLVKSRTLNIDAKGNLEMAGQSVPLSMKMSTEEIISKK